MNISMRTLAISLPALALAAVVLSGCRPDRPEQSPATERPATQPAQVRTDTATAAAAHDTVATADTFALEQPGVSPGPAGNGRARRAPAWNRSELVKGVQGFVTAIDSNNQELFWGSLSRRSIGMIDGGKLAPRADVWNAARQTLGDIQNRRITVVGGSRDSVALKIEGLRLVDGVREDDPVIIHLLHEGTEWKVMYPGLLYPGHHLQR
jgi:hypothetical protein